MTCEICGGPLLLMGTLGHLDHVKCRNCGMWFTKSTGIGVPGVCQGCYQEEALCECLPSTCNVDPE